jgi:hypothetical protein
MPKEIEWHDATEIPPTGVLLWTYISEEIDFIEVCTYLSGIWKSVDTPPSTYEFNKVNAWALIEIPNLPTRTWLSQPVDDPDKGIATT